MPSASKMLFPLLIASIPCIIAQAQAELPDALWIPCTNNPSKWCTDLYFCSGPWANLTTAPMPTMSNGFAYGFRTKYSKCVPGAGPVLRMTPGQVYKVTLHNVADRLPASIPANTPLGMMMKTDWGVAPGLPPPGVKAWLNMNLPLHTTNLGLQGVHVSAVGDHDNVQKTVLPGDCATYTYNIPANHMGGTFLYRANFYGRTEFQIIGGAAGMVIIEDQPIVGLGPLGAPLDPAVYTFLTDRNLERRLVAMKNGPVTQLGNGDPLGAPITLTANQWFRLRIAVARTEAFVGTVEFMENPLVGLSSISPQMCEIYDIAHDGVYFTTTPFMPYAPNRVTSTYAFEISGFTRLDLAIRCMNPAAPGFTLELGAAVVARFTVVPAPLANPFPATVASPFTSLGAAQWASARPPYLAELRPGFPGYPAYIKTVMPAVPITANFDGFNAVSFNPLVPLQTVVYGNSTVYTFNLLNTDMHPTNLRTQHFQVVQPGGCPPLREGQRYDTVLVAVQGAGCLVSVQFDDFSGMDIIQSANTLEQDIGAASWFNVPFQAPGSFEASPAYLPLTPNAPCCVPNVDANGVQICQFIAECGSNVGINSCNEPCIAPVNACPPSKPLCSSTGVCFKLAMDDGVLNLDSQCSQPIVPWVLMGVSLFAGASAIVFALVIVRRNSRKEAVLSMDQPCVLSLPRASPTPC